MLSFAEARRKVEEVALTLRPTASENVSLLKAHGRVLAENITADRDLPPFPRVTRDGFALRAGDLGQLPARLHVIAEIPAGSPLGSCRVGPGQAAEIMTGAALPEGADAVVMVESTHRDGDDVLVERAVIAGENFVPKAAEARSGQVLLGAGTRLTPAALAVAASVGRHEVAVHQRPRVAILSTGDEVVPVESMPAPHQIRNSNSYSLAAQVQQAGGEPVLLPIAPDEPNRLRGLIAEGLEVDLLLLTGGVSMGKYDLVEPALATFGAEFLFTSVAIQPGKPLVFGRARRRPDSPSVCFFGLPGNPVSTMVTFELFARVVAEALAGLSPRPLAFTHARLKSDVKTKTGLTRFLPAHLSGPFADARVELIRWQGSGDVVSQARANCLLVIPPDRDLLPAGEFVAVHKL